MSDLVNHPGHYTSGNIECIDAIRSALGEDGFAAFLRGQVIKYQWRMGRKGGAFEASQDAARAVWYARRLVDLMDASQSPSMTLDDHIAEGRANEARWAELQKEWAA